MQRTIFADSGRLDYTTNQEDAVLTLWDGQIHHRDITQPGEYEVLDFERQQLVMRGVSSRLERAREDSRMRSDREMDLGTLVENVRIEQAKIDTARQELRAVVTSHVATLTGDTLVLAPKDTVGFGAVRSQAPVDQERFRANTVERLSQGIDYASRQRSKYLVEYHKKFAIPFACLIFILVGAPIGVRAKRGGYGFAMGLSTLAFVFYYMALTGGEDLADRRFLPPWLAMWMANIVFLAFGIWLFSRASRDSRTYKLKLPKWWPRRKLAA